MPRSVVSAWMPQHPLLDVTAFHSEQDGSWFALLNDTLSIPFLVSVLFICFQVLNGLAVFVAYVTRRPSITPQEAELLESNSQTEHPATLWQWARNQVDYLGGKTITSYLAARFVGCLVLLFYASVLAFISLTVKKWSVLATRYNVILLLTTFSVYLQRDIWPLAIVNGRPQDETGGGLLWVKIMTLFATSTLIPLFIPRRYIPVDPKNPMPVPNDEQTCSLFSLFLYTFLDPVIMQGKEYTILALTLVGQGLFQFLAPIGINRILKNSYLETGGENADIRPWFWILCIFAGPAIRAIFFQGYIFIGTRTLVRTEGLLTQLIFETYESSSETSKGQASESYTSTVVGTPETASISSTQDGGASSSSKDRKSKVAGSSSSSPSISQDMAKEVPNEGKNLIGKINNLVTTDLTNIVEARDFLVLFLFIPLQVVLSVFFLYRLLGWSTFLGLGAMVVLFPIPGYIAKRMQDLQKLKMNKSDARIQDVTEVPVVLCSVNILRMIKLFGVSWLNNHNSYAIPTIVMVVTYGGFTLIMKEELNPSKIFSSMAVFSILRIQLFRTSSLIQYVITGKVSLDRLNDFLKRTELLDSFVETDAHVITPAQETASVKNDTIGFRNAVFSWSVEPQDGSLTPRSRSFRLHVPGELFFKPDSINLIIGPTGSGKTALLMALLGEMHFIRSSADSWFNLPREGGIAYAAQESWVLNETIRENILFGLPYDEGRYRKVIQQSGDQTEVGEKGLTLRCARVTLARAIYSPAKIILLDDVLAALDTHTSSWIVDKCFQGDLVKGRTILLVTHNIALATPVAGYIISLGQDGTVQTQDVNLESAVWNPKLAEGITLDSEIPDMANQELQALAHKTPGVNDGKLIMKEDIAEGHITWKSLKLFFSGLGGKYQGLFFSIWLSGFVLALWGNTFQIWFLGYWGTQYENHPPSEVHDIFYISIYSLGLLITLGTFNGAYLFYMLGSIRASRTINTLLINSVLTSTLRWLDETPTGRIISRCTQDIRAVDSAIPQGLGDLAELSISVITSIGTIVIFTPLFLFPAIAMTAFVLFLGNVYLKAQLSVKREMSNARSPLLAHFSAAISGVVSIRAYGAQAFFKAESLKRVDHYVRIARTSYNLNRWIAIRIDFLGDFFTASLAAYLVSLERIQGFIDIEHEPLSSEGGKPPAAWPSSGDFEGPKVLHDLTFHISSGERVGIVGRTGSGKSSLTLALLRCIITEGLVYYDCLPTNKLNLNALRSNITIIPQMPELLSGTLRRNLDLFDQHDDATLNDALRAAGLFSLQEEASEAHITLDSNIASGGSNLSIGQRQILALARAMIRGSNCLFWTKVDYKTDSVIQRTLRHQLPSDVTVITVAHRLQTIMDADKIMVLDNGRIGEFDRPSVLLQKEDGCSGHKSTLYAMAEEKA
ncbi:P-loop containing nucleoside triphosphate hydrolase protein [Gymnopilus junonius]|uniref:P-loop containing nucleoside triphosphate hydrolase protein n=1 Tax=Gymnopilus junonius TaxID=109634 RepID=A0A9P5NES9_GYMJU|nr:P-loop containing nucleoside triphosphate hydrolase protein [Gymnopilus junonius]